MQPANIINHLQRLLTRPRDSHKFSFGHVLVVGGSSGLEGAAILSAYAALRTGAGLATIASPLAIHHFAARSPEIMVHSIAAQAGQWVADILEYVHERKVSVLVIGPGLSTEYRAAIRQLSERIDCPAVLDATAIDAFADNLDALMQAGASNPSLILTPHPGEYRRLLAHHPPDTPPDLFAQQHHVSLVYKAAPASVHAANGDKYRNTTGNPGMATAGSGDVLSGVIAGLLAQGLPPFVAACAAVQLHGRAGDMASAQFGEPSMLASDIITQLPAALQSYR